MMETKLKALVAKLADIKSKVRAKGDFLLLGNRDYCGKGH